MINRIYPVFFFFLLVLATACQVKSTVNLEIDEDSSGLVSVDVYMDQSASSTIGDLRRQLHTSDLVDAGWKLTGVDRTEDGGSRIVASKPFRALEDLDLVLSEIFGSAVFNEVSLLRNRSFAATEWKLTGNIDLSAGLSLFSDRALQELLSGLPLGRTPEELMELADCDFPCDPAQFFSFDFMVTLPDGSDSFIEPTTWSAQLGDQTPVSFELISNIEYSAPKIWLGVTLSLIGVSVLVLVLQFIRLFFKKRSTPARAEPIRAYRQAAEIIEKVPETSNESDDRRIKLVVVGGTGVLWEGETGSEGPLVPFVRESGGLAGPEEIADRYRSASLGQVSTEEFWSSLGVLGDPDELDHLYLSQVKLRSDAVPFLNQMTTREIPVACMTNTVLSWVEHLQQNLGIEELIEHWVVSGEVGARKPSNAMFEALRRKTGVRFANMLLIDSDLPTLDSGRGVGMSTVMMRSQALVPGKSAHPVVDGFVELFRSTS